MPDHSWMKSAMMVILTMREADTAAWDADDVVRFAQSFSADTIGYSCAGVAAFYPTEVPFHRRAEGLDGRDLVGQTLRAARRESMRVPGPDRRVDRREGGVPGPAGMVRGGSRRAAGRRPRLLRSLSEWRLLPGVRPSHRARAADAL